MTLPERPFIARLLHELGRHRGGIPAAADEMGLDRRIVSLLASGSLPTKAELATIRAWLDRVAPPLTDLEAAHFELLAHAAPVVRAELEQLAPAPAPRQTREAASIQPRRPGTLVLTAAVSAVVAVLLTLVIVLVLRHSPSSGSPAAASQSTGTVEPASSSPQPAATPASSQPSSATAPSATIQWTGHLTLTGYGSDLTTKPPQSDASSSGGTGDVYASGDSISPLDQTPLAVWPGSSLPTASQCQSRDATQNTGNPVPITPGTVICAEPGPGLVAVIKVISIDAADSTIDTSTTVWITRT